MTPPLSLITITYNAQDVLLRTLQSIESQSTQNIEHIIIDGKSTDSTLTMIQEYVERNKNKNISIKYISEHDQGIYDAMNKGLQMASGQYVWFMNAGDTLYNPQTLKTLLAQSTNADILYGDTALVNNTGTFLSMRRLKPPIKLTWKSFKMGMLVCHQAFIVKREIAPLYNPQYKLSADIDWCINCLKAATKIHNTHQTLCNFLTQGVSSQQRKKALTERFKIMSHHYGYIPTMMRHLWFALRFYTTKLLGKQI
ncbi:MAG: glycosyltransferase family 2 protein [Bacteroidales bacterium]